MWNKQRSALPPAGSFWKPRVQGRLGGGLLPLAIGYPEPNPAREGRPVLLGLHCSSPWLSVLTAQLNAASRRRASPHPTAPDRKSVV